MDKIKRKFKEEEWEERRLALGRDEKSNLAFMFMPLIFEGRSGGKSKGKSATSDSIHSFIDAQLVRCNVTEYLSRIDAVERPQPFIIILYSESVLQPSQCFVVLERHALPQPSLLKAVDLCYKVHFVMDLNYQVDCRAVWKFIEAIYQQPDVSPQKENSQVRQFRAYMFHHKEKK
nr:uncharacterized protein LOC129281710 [Lytechinus pictus]